MKTIKCKNNFGDWEELPIKKFSFRPSVYGLIINNDEIVVLHNKSNQKIWLPGGGVEIGEKITDALKREIREETGLEVEVKEIILTKENFFYYKPLDEAYHAFLFFFICKPKNKDLISDDQVDDLESEKPRWKKIKAIQKENWSDLNEDLDKLMQKII